MDKVAYVCASKHAGTYCVTVNVENVEFLQPVEVGDLVSLHASVNYVGNSSLIIGIRVVAENVKQRLVKHTNSSYFTMVAKGDDDKPVQVPKLILQTKEEVKRFIEAMHLKKIRSKIKASMSDVKSLSEVERADEILKSERCEIKLVV
jgi:acyl-CoA hydrolase